MKCWGGTNARSISTSATTIFFASFLNPSSAVDAIATTWFKNLWQVSCTTKANKLELEKYQIKHIKGGNLLKKKRGSICSMITSLLKGGYLPRPGVAFAAAETMSTSTRCTCFGNNNSELKGWHKQNTARSYMFRKNHRRTCSTKDHQITQKDL